MFIVSAAVGLLLTVSMGEMSPKIFPQLNVGLYEAVTRVQPKLTVHHSLPSPQVLSSCHGELD